MGEIKSVKVDNWGVFFLQKLQNFFNKTDYCDLTLQFKDNSQLKVHRLVLSACTDFFNVLEQTCEFVDDALVMPNELQADVVVPIVNFMYTGTLEFELKMYGKLLKTAKEMNMTVLLKLLEAHRRTMEGVTKGLRPASPKGARGRTRGPGGPPQRIIVPSASSSNTAGTQQRRILTIPDASTARRSGQMSTTTAGTMTNKPTSITYFRQQNTNTGTTTLLKQHTPTKMQKGPTRFECADSNNLSETYETSFDSISYESKPIKAEEEDDYSIQSSISPVKKRSSPFEQLRSEGYSNNKRPANITLLTPPAKKPNIEDVKEFAEQQRMRKQIAAEYGDDQEYDGLMDDDIHNDDDDDDCAIGGGGGGTVTTSIVSVGQTPQKQQQQQSAGPSVVIKQEPNEKPTIVVKDSTNSTMNHAKIISEVLRQYPHLVKSNKNIKLKIMPNSSGKSQKIIVKKEAGGGNTSADVEQKTQTQTQSVVRIHQSKQAEKVLVSPTYSQQQAQQKPVAAITPSASVPAAAAGAAGAGAGQKRRIDSKTMHALIAQGAENTTGPWLCLRCGINGRPISIPSYRGFRRHLINTHKEKIDPALCEHCGWRSTDNRHLHYHLHMEHKHPSTLYTFPECLICSHISVDAVALNQHMTENHPEEGNKQQCIYCNKIFAKEMQLFNHMKTNHKQRALEDGIIDFSDDEFVTDDDSRSTANSKDNNKKKIKIISDISLPSTILKLEPSSEAEALSTVASGIATSIGIETEEFITSSNASASQSNEMKFVTADGNEMVLSAEQREQLLSQLEQDHEGSVVMVLNDTGIFQQAPVAVAAEPATVTTPTPPPPPPPPLPATANDNDNTTAEDDEDNASNKNVNPSAEIEDTMEEENVHDDDEEQEEGEEETTAEEDYEDRNSFNDTSTEAKNKEEHLSKLTNESKESNEDNENDHHMEWAENLISAQDMDDENEEEHKKSIEVKKNTTSDIKKADEKNVRAENPQKDDDISIKLKMLTGDWSEDEVEDEDEMNNSAAASLSTENIVKENISDKSRDEKKKIATDELSPDDCESTDVKKKRSSVDSKKVEDDNLDDLKTILTDFPRKKSADAKETKDDAKMDAEIKTSPKDIKEGRSDDDEKEPINKPNESKEKELNEVRTSSDDNKLDESSSAEDIKEEMDKEHEKSTSFEEVSKEKEDHQINAGRPLSLGVLLPCAQASPVTVEETKSTAASDPSKTEDRMKSLISDWGDDDDEDDEDL